jgi:hypothetical protein
MNAVPASLSDDLSGGRQTEAERSFWHKAAIGGVVGAIVGALFYAGVVAVALAGRAIELGPVVWIGAIVGVFGGVFLGSWGGVMAGLKQLEDTEHDLIMERNGQTH